jgi:hypothetical protein
LTAKSKLQEVRPLGEDSPSERLRRELDEVLAGVEATTTRSRRSRASVRG